MSDKLKQDISIGDNLRFLRKRAKLSQEDVSAKLDLMGLSTSREIISQMELGRYSIRISVLLALKQIYNVAAFDEFFKDLELK
ncbi:MAG: helix-turn-helix transcriptional regulator [Oscillospiraceae bacterium]|jgi:transcriptional regulator with XRE-family HTH domain|nr:helix-turn-helix transcriptional regulator [Oscillospiraceae bacterium]MCI9588399.1 helix-turn-helix transcriptional regulator [Oscillospiraceae bacterium]